MSQAFSSLVPSGPTHFQYLWREGEIIPWESATIHVTAVGHASVSSVFEGIKAYWNTGQEQLYVFRLKEHMQRFVDSIRMVAYRTDYQRSALEAAVLELLKANAVREDVYIRPWMFTKGDTRRVMVPADTEAEIVIDMWPFTSNLFSATGSRVRVSSWTRLSDNQMPPRIKAFSNYHNGRMAILEAERDGYDSAILLNSNLKVSEGPGACLALVRGGRLVTPRITDGILESITRESILEMARDDLGMTVEEREVDRTELYLAEEVFFVGTGREVSPIVNVDGFTVGSGEPGPVARQLAEAYNALVRGENPAHAEWRAPVW